MGTLTNPKFEKIVAWALVGPLAIGALYCLAVGQSLIGDGEIVLGVMGFACGLLLALMAYAQSMEAKRVGEIHD